MDKFELRAEYIRLMDEASESYTRFGIAGCLDDNRKKAYQITQILALVFNETIYGRAKHKG